MSAAWFLVLLGIVPGLCAGIVIMFFGKHRVPFWDMVWFVGSLLLPAIGVILAGIIVQRVFL